MNATRPPAHPSLTPEMLDHTPELVILAALEATLELALTHLRVVHPKLMDPECPAWARDDSPHFIAAEKLVARARACLRAIRTYRARCPTPDEPPCRRDDF